MMEKTFRLTANEREAMLRLYVAVEILLVEPEHLARRVSRVKYGKRDFAMIRAKVNRMLTEMLTTVPKDQLRSLVMNLKTSSYVVGVKQPGSVQRDGKNFGTWASWDTLNALLAGCHDKCTLCDLDRQGRKSCDLRKALDSIPNDMADRETGDCPYYTMI